MAGGFETAYYEPDNVTDYGTMLIRVDTDTLLATFGTTANDGSGTAPTKVHPTVYAKGSARRYGRYARTAVVEFAIADTPTGYKPGQRYAIPVMLKSVFASLKIGDDVTYLGKAAKIKALYPEYCV